MIYQTCCFLPSGLLENSLHFPLIHLEWKSFHDNHSGDCKCNCTGQGLTEIIWICASDPDRLSGTQQSCQDVPSSVFPSYTVQQTLSSPLSNAKFVWDLRLSVRGHRVSKTEKGDVIPNTGSKCEPWLCEQSDLILQESLSLQGQGGISCSC